MTAWVVPCDTLMAAMAIPDASCGGARIHTILPPGVSLGSSYVAQAFDDKGVNLPPVEFRVDPGAVAPLVPDASRVQGLPDVILDPVVFGDAGAGFPVTRLYVTTDGVAASGERVRAAIQAADPTAWVFIASGKVSSVPQFAEVARIVGLGLIGSLLLAGCSLAVATMTGLLERRREFTFLRAAGMPVSRLRVLVLLQAGVPLVVVSGFSALLGVVVAQADARPVAGRRPRRQPGRGDGGRSGDVAGGGRSDASDVVAERVAAGAARRREAQEARRLFAPQFRRLATTQPRPPIQQPARSRISVGKRGRHST
jgi:hypothetical protein